MILNDDKLKLAKDLFEDLCLQDCPAPLKVTAEHLVRMLNVGKLPHYPDDYTKVGELDRVLTVEYWTAWDGLAQVADLGDFRDWFIKMATNPDLISRARRWLVENRYIILPTAIAERTLDAEENWRGQIAKGAKDGKA